MGRVDELIRKFQKVRGWSRSVHRQIAESDPDFFEIYIRWSGHMYEKGPLPRKVKELILIGVDASTTHLYTPGLRQHIRNALDAGATKEEILEVLELVTLVGWHSMNVGVPILEEEASGARSPIQG